VIPGIDVSRHQGAIDWQAVARSGVRCAWVKATEGRDYVDPRFAANLSGARAAGLAVGAYHFARPSSAPEQQAEHFLRTVGEVRPGDLPPALDLEVGGFADPVGWAVAFLEAVERRVGRAVLYTYHSYWQVTLRRDQRLARWPLWIARYGADPGIGLVWQYTSNGSVPGIAGRVDRNWFRGDEQAFRRFCAVEDRRPWAMVKGFSPELGVLPHLLRVAAEDATSGPWKLVDFEVRVVDPANLRDVPGWSIAFGFTDPRFESVAGATWRETARLIVRRLGLDR
jgi:GH25 family lysozyme M1 (1,4-beta-N-acetylmuramidase)